ncbi:dehydrogenase/reductase SDR family member 12-like [Clytia hemisphaerica]|uniref:Dehydrogenase/reductase (SDR family) member 12 n=1 Tax=Clytia hemisphaerica TaxID=252671 RepID=A0A7M5WLX8_9CNID
MSIYRNVIWFTKGIREYCKSGYEHAAKTFESLEGVRLEGRSYMITGANSGIGKEAAMKIASMGGIVHLVCRNEQRGQEALKEIKTQSGSEEVHLHLLDMSQSREVHKFTKDFTESGRPLNVLINNAGCMVNTRELNEEGVEKNFATNTLGTYLLTTGLINHLQNSESPQVITVSSGGMLVNKLDSSDFNFEQMNPFDGTMAYSQNKRQQIEMTDHWSVQYPNIQFTTMHPGWADTPAVRNSMPDFYEKMKNRLRTTEQGADTIVWLATSSTARKAPSGGFYQDRAPVSKHLPLAWTKSSEKERKVFTEKLETLASKFRS